MICLRLLKMLKKIYQADFLLLPEHEFWNMYILLRKGKDFYYECAGRCTEELPDSRGFYTYEHACFTLDGQVLSVNKKCAPHSLLISKRPSKKTKKHLERKLKWPLKLFLKRKSLKSLMNWENYLKERS